MEDYTNQIQSRDIPKILIESLPEYVNLISQINRIWLKYIGSDDIIPYAQNNNELADEYSDVKEPFPGQLVPWFRGNIISSYELEPALLRKNNPIGIITYLKCMNVAEDDHEKVLQVIKGIEGYMKRRFITSGIPYANVQSKDIIRWVILMQHNGLPTRLLDWTKNALTALFFAVRSCPNKEDKKEKYCSVWMLDPRRLQESHPEGRRKIYTDADQKVKDYLHLSGDSTKCKVPIAFIPSHVHERISAQQSRFTLHNHVKNSLNKFGEEESDATGCPPLIQILIPCGLKQKIRDDLRLMGVSVQEIVPGLDSISSEIMTRMRKGVIQTKDIETQEYFHLPTT